MLTRHYIYFSVLFLLTACSTDSRNLNQASLLVYNANIWAGKDELPASTMIVDAEGKIIALASDTTDWADQLGEQTERIDAEGAFVMPGFIEGHGHFSGLGSSLRNLNFLRSRSWDEIVAMVAERAEETPEGDWITGRGWHQEKWDKPHDHSIGGYPIHDELSTMTQDNPVVLRHASGHALFANNKAMELAGVSRETPDPRGGRILRDDLGDPIGVFEERAMDLITDAYQNFVQTMTPRSQEGRMAGRYSRRPG